MRGSSRLAIVALVLLAAVTPAAAGIVNVSVGYLNNLSGPPNPADIPTPFDSDATTTLIGSGNSTTPHDTGVLRLENVGGTAITVDPGLNVVTQGAVFQIWDAFLPFALGAGQSLVLVETANFNFDSSDFGLGTDPVVSGSVSGIAFSFTDTGRVLLGHEEAGNTAETTPYALLGRVTVPDQVPAPSALALVAVGLVVVRIARGQRRS